MSDSAPGPTLTTSPASSSPSTSGAPGGGGYMPRRCRMSGRLTPAAATLTNTSPGLGTGTGRRTSARPPAPSATTACIEAGRLVTRGLLTWHCLRSTIPLMDLEELFPSKPGDPLVELARQDLDPISIEELHARIEALKAEIARVEAHMQRAQTHRSAAEELFKKS